MQLIDLVEIRTSNDRLLMRETVFSLEMVVTEGLRGCLDFGIRVPFEFVGNGKTEK